MVAAQPAPGNHPLPEPFDEAFLACPHAALAGLGDSAPVVAVRTPAGRTAHVVLTDEQVRAGLLDPRLTLRQGTTRRPDVRPRDLNLMNYLPEEHTRMRRLLASALSTRRVAGYRPAVVAAADRLSAALADSGNGTDLLTGFARPYAFQVVCDVLGVEPAAREGLYRTANGVFAAAANAGEAPSIDDVHAVMEREIRDRRAGTTRPDLLAEVVARAGATGAASEDELVSLATMLMLAGLESSAQMICLCVVELSRRPAVREHLGTEPEQLTAVVEELLRFTTPGPFATARYAAEELSLGGCPVPAGGTVLMSLVAANRDAAVHDRPDDFDPDRPGADRHVTFGWGPHFCPGAALARLELRVALATLYRRYPALRPAVPETQLRWQGSYRHRGLAALPVHLR